MIETLSGALMVVPTNVISITDGQIYLLCVSLAGMSVLVSMNAQQCYALNPFVQNCLLQNNDKLVPTSEHCQTA